MARQKTKVIILRTAGTNCDQETGFAFEYFGAAVDFVHINKLFQKEVSLSDYHILAVPGGFSYGDDIAAGRILANELRIRLGKDIKKFIQEGKLIIGICNGFQILVKAGILPGITGFNANGSYSQEATLMMNDSGKFEDRWTHLSIAGKSVWTQGLEENVYFPVAHAEGKFVPKDENILKQLQKKNQIVFRYSNLLTFSQLDEQRTSKYSGLSSREKRSEIWSSTVQSKKERPINGSPVQYPQNPNGSVESIAGICDGTGRVLGLMPHPERHFFFTQHPSWTRFEEKKELGDGAKIFENGVRYIKNHLLKS